jgi:hypothetical protein
MTNAEVSGSELVAKRPHHRSSVSNGRRLFAIEGMDGRTYTGRRFRDLIEEITIDLGGAGMVSTAQKQLIRRAATLSIMCESLEAQCVQGHPFDCELYGSLTDRLGRCLQRLGLSRLARDVNAEDRSLDVILGRANAEDVP